MNTHLVISLDTRRLKKDGTFPIVLRLSHFMKTTTIATGISALAKDWCEDNRKIKTTYKGTESVTRLNNLLQKLRSEAMDTVIKLQDEGQLKSMSVKELKERLAPKKKNTPPVNQKSVADLVLQLHKKGELTGISYSALKEKVYQGAESASFLTHARMIIALLRKSGKEGSAKWHEDSLMALLNFTGADKDILFTDINYSFLTRFEAHHLGKGNSINSLSTYLRSIRSLYNKAIKAGLVTEDVYPFKDYQIRKEPTQKRALESDDIQKIIALELSPDHTLFDTRNYFLASYMLYGMNFIDLASLEQNNFVNGRIQYRRDKTSKLYDIKIMPQVQEILDYYKNERNCTTYLFPILSATDTRNSYQALLLARRLFNNKLKKIAHMCGIATTLTSYVSRHSFATLAMQKDVPLNAISSMLGHSSLRTTEIYLKSLPTKTLDDYNNVILGE
ncbi:MAG: phage integrase SAM-like domain-containing protein [Bacteroidota bacterium]